MISSPPSASAGSSLYIALPAVQSSSYIGGAQASTRSMARGRCVTWRSFERSAASAQAATGSPTAMAPSPAPSTVSAISVVGVGTSSAAAWIIARTGVSGDADGAAHAREGAEPMRDVDHVGAADAGEVVLVAAREAHHLVGEGGSEDDDGSASGTARLMRTSTSPPRVGCQRSPAMSRTRACGSVPSETSVPSSNQPWLVRPTWR
jgi:hypothetical protein